MKESEAVKAVLEDPAARDVVADARAFDALRESEAWIRLRDLLEISRDEWLYKIARRFVGPKERFPTPEEVAYHRGFYEGFQALLKTPDVNARNLERLAERAWRLYTEGQPEEGDS